MVSLAILKVLALQCLWGAVATAKDQIIERDVAIIGGGSAGIYSAIRLRDAGKSVVVVEAKDVIGGHAETYKDPATGTPLNLGVVVFVNQTVVLDYFKRLNTELIPLAGGSSGVHSYIDFATGRNVTDYKPTPQARFQAALKKYAQQVARFPSLQQGFNMTYPVDEDLLLPFGQFVDKHGLQDIMSTTFLYNQGYAPYDQITTLYMLKYLNAKEVFSLQQGFLTTATHNTHTLYDNAAKVLGRDVLYRSTVHDMKRSDKGVEVRVDTPSGRKVLRVKKLVSAVPPTPENTKRWDTSAAERRLFGQFYSNGYQTAVIKHSGLAANASWQGVGVGTRYGLPKLPGLYTVSQVPDTDLTQAYYGNPKPFENDRARADMLGALRRVLGPERTSKAQIVAYTDHSPFNLMVAPQAIRGGFYRELLALQGARSTWYVGAAWQAQDSSAIWQQVDGSVLPGLLASLR